MTNEIKEIKVNKANKSITFINNGIGFSQLGIADEILDLITNLQEENERLKEENKHIFANVNDDELLRSNAMNWAEAQDYKQRIDKAIEYIEDIIERFNKINDKELISNRLVDIECIEKLYDILRGDE